MSVDPIGLPEALERAASALPEVADSIRPANGDPGRLAEWLEPAGAERVLVWLLRNEPDAGAELVSAWEGDARTQPVLLGIEPEGLPKPARKALRRALHRLRSRGVALPERSAAAVVATLPRVDDRIDEARVTALDAHGARLAYLAVDHPAGGARLFEMALDDERGVVEFDLFSAARRRVRRYLRDIEQREAWPGVAAPSSAVRALVARAASRQATDRPLPRGFGEWRARLCDVADGTPTPGQLAREALGAPEPTRDSLEALAGCVSEGRLVPCLPPQERLRPLLERLDELARSVVVASPAARREQVDAALAEALDAVYDEGQRGRCAERLEENAFVDWKGGREEVAREGLAAARAFRERAAAENPIARAMLERLLAPAIERALSPEAFREHSGEEAEDAAVPSLAGKA